MIESKHLIKVEFSGDSKPYSAAGKYYLRTADEDREISPEELKTFFELNKYRSKWENSKSGTLLKQVDKLAVKLFWQKAITAGRLTKGEYDTSIILKRFGLAKGEYLTNAGEFLFGTTKPISLKAGIFATDEKLTILDMKLYEDNIYNLLKKAEDYIFKNIRWRVEIIDSERNEIPEIPKAVIREVLANSFAHAMYGSRTNHEICIHPNMISVYSPGDYASRYKPEEYIKGNVESEIRNATISKILYMSKYIEQFGSGFKRIDSLCKDSRIKYSYENKDNGFKFIIYRPQIQSDIFDVTLNVTLNETEKAIFALLKKKPDSSREELADKISKSVRTVQRLLNSLVDKGYIRRVGSKQNPIWETLK